MPSETTHVTFRDGQLVLRIPEGYGPGDLVVLHLVDDRVMVKAGVLEDLVRSYHEMQVGDDRLVCPCGAVFLRGLEEKARAHVEHAVREALAGRATV